MGKNRISVEMFCKQFNALSKGNAKQFNDFLNKHIIKKYIPYMEKDAWCTKIVEISTKIHNEDIEIVKFNSSARYLLFTMRLISLYTDIDIIFDNGIFIQQYDLLDEVGAINKLMSTIPQDEFMEFTSLLNMKIDDFRDNEYSVTALLYNLKKSVSLSENIITSAMDELGNNKNDRIENNDINEIDNNITNK